MKRSLPLHRCFSPTVMQNSTEICLSGRNDVLLTTLPPTAYSSRSFKCENNVEEAGIRSCAREQVLYIPKGTLKKWIPKQKISPLVLCSANDLFRISHYFGSTRFSLTTAFKIFGYPSSKRPVRLLSLSFPHLAGVIMRSLRPISTQGVRDPCLSVIKPTNTKKMQRGKCPVCLLQKNSCASRISVQLLFF